MLVETEPSSVSEPSELCLESNQLLVLRTHLTKTKKIELDVINSISSVSRKLLYEPT